MQCDKNMRQRSDHLQQCLQTVYYISKLSVFPTVFTNSNYMSKLSAFLEHDKYRVYNIAPSRMSWSRQVMACPAHGPPQLMFPWLNSMLDASSMSFSSCSWLIASDSVMAGRVVTHIVASTCYKYIYPLTT